MSHLLRTVVALALLCGVGRRRRSWTAPLVVSLWAPMIGFAVGVGGAALGLRRRVQLRRRAAQAASAELSTLGELVGIGLTSGMVLVEALGFAARQLTSDLAAEVDSVTRAITGGGSAAAMAAAGGTAGRLYLLVGRAMATGAPVLGAVEAFADEHRADERARREAAVRRLPVMLVFPLALLILPGFVLLLLTPVLVAALARLGL